MKHQYKNLPGIAIACVALLFGAATTIIPVAAQETTYHELPNGVSSDLDDHDRGPQNGDLAVSATTVVDGAYGTAQIATLPNDGGPYHFLTTVDTVPNGASIRNSLQMEGVFSSGYLGMKLAETPLCRFRLEVAHSR